MKRSHIAETNLAPLVLMGLLGCLGACDSSSEEVLAPQPLDPASEAQAEGIDTLLRLSIHTGIDPLEVILGRLDLRSDFALGEVPRGDASFVEGCLLGSPACRIDTTTEKAVFGVTDIMVGGRSATYTRSPSFDSVFLTTLDSSSRRRVILENLASFARLDLVSAGKSTQGAAGISQWSWIRETDTNSHRVRYTQSKTSYVYSNTVVADLPVSDDASDGPRWDSGRSSRLLDGVTKLSETKSWKAIGPGLLTYPSLHGSAEVLTSRSTGESVQAIIEWKPSGPIFRDLHARKIAGCDSVWLGSGNQITFASGSDTTTVTLSDSSLESPPIQSIRWRTPRIGSKWSDVELSVTWERSTTTPYDGGPATVWFEGIDAQGARHRFEAEVVLQAYAQPSVVWKSFQRSMVP